MIATFEHYSSRLSAWHHGALVARFSTGAERRCMPNWCHNQLTVCGPVEDVRHFKEKAVGHSPWLPPEQGVAEQPNPLNFHSLFPVPEALVGRGDIVT